MPEIEGILEEIETIDGKFGLQDLKIKVGGIDFYKTLWDDNVKKLGPENFLGVSVNNAGFPKQEFFEKLEKSKGRKVRVCFKDISTLLPYFILDRLNRIKIPKKYREILSVRYSEKS